VVVAVEAILTEILMVKQAVQVVELDHHLDLVVQVVEQFHHYKEMQEVDHLAEQQLQTKKQAVVVVALAQWEVVQQLLKQVQMAVMV
jgi:hypothetical protein